jgi:hypothetical protein
MRYPISHLHEKSHGLSVGLTEYHGISHGMPHGIYHRVNGPLESVAERVLMNSMQKSDGGNAQKTKNITLHPGYLGFAVS